MHVTWRNSVGTVSADVYRTRSAAPGCAKFAKVFLLLVSLVGLGTWGGNAYAATCTSTGTGNWSAAGTWSCVGLPAATVPGVADTVVIANINHTVTVDVNSAALSVTFTGGNRTSVLQLSPAITLTVAGAVTLNEPTGAATKALNVGAGTLNAASILIDGGGNGGNAATVSVSTGTITTTGSLTFLGTASDAALTSTGASTINIGGNLGSGGTLTTGGTGTINFNGAGAQSIGIYTTFNNVTINKSAGTATLLGATSMTGALTVTAGTLDISTFALGVAGNLAVNGAVTGTSGAITLSGAGTTIDGTGSITTTTGALTITAAKSILSTANLTIASPIAITGAVTVTNSGIITSTSATGITGSLAGSTWVNAAGSTLNVSGPLLATGTLTANAAVNTVNYTGAAQTVNATAYSNLGLGGSGVKTLTGVSTIGGNLTMSGTATATAAAALTVGGNFSIGATNTFANGAFALNVAGNFDQSGTFTAGAGVVTLDGGAAVQTISGTGPLGFANLTVNNTGGITLARNVTVTSAIIGVVTLTSTCPIDYTLTSSAGTTVQHSCGSDHILITHAGSALTCSPQTVTITACANVACTAPHYSGTVNVTLTPGGQTFAIDASGINSAATVQQSTAGAVILDATSVPASTNVATCWNTATSTASCAMTFSDSGFLVTVPDHVSCNSATATIEAVENAPGTGRCVPAYQNVTRAVNLYSSYANPVTGTQVVTASTGVVSTAAPGTAHNLVFDVNGTATITLSYPDAGQLTLTAGDTAPTGLAMTGSGSFVVAPASFVFSGIPAAPLTAGQPFNATVTAMNACGTPAATPNFDGTVTITSSNPQPGLGNATAISTTLSGFVNGAASLNLTWDEVGTIDLNASIANYLGSALSVSGTQAGAGRFQPAYFDTVVTQGCSTFTYAGTTAPVKAGQPFTVTVTANKTGGGITANYAGAANAYLTTLSNAGVTAGFASNTIAAASFANGVGSANVTYEVATPQTAPLTLTLRAADADTPVVSSSGHTEGATEIRSGRAKISNAHGSERLALPVPFRAEYWNNGWVSNPADSCSGDGLLGSTVSVSLSALPATCVQDTGIGLGLSGAGCAAAGPTGQRFKEGGVAGFVGNFNLWLKAPGAGNTGAVTVTGNVPTWLQFDWNTAAAGLENPSSRATFGVYKGSNEFIYLRENY